MPASRRLKTNGKSLSEQAYHRIRNQILSGELLVGDMLSRRRLAEQFNMSFLPITEALGRLETEGLVESRPRIGTRVRIPTEQNIRDSNVIREALESQAARLCTERITDEEKEQLLRSAQHLDELQAVCARDPVDSRFMVSVHTYHMEFHTRIANLSGCPGLSRAIEKEQVLIFNWLYDVAANRRTQPEQFHLKLAEELCSNDPQRADAAMRAHVRYGIDQILEQLSSLGDIGNWKREKHR